MSEQNYIALTDGRIEFKGFSRLSQTATFCFYQSGVVISPIEREGKYYYKTIELDENRGSSDKEIIDILKKDRKFSEKEYFLFSDNAYIEINPHRSTL